MVKLFRKKGIARSYAAGGLAAVCLLYILSGCQSSAGRKPSDDPISDFVSEPGDALSDPGFADGGDKDNNGLQNERECFGDDIHFYYASDFSEGLAWVEFLESDRQNGGYQDVKDAVQAVKSDPDSTFLDLLDIYNSVGSYRGGIIDTDGRLIWESPLTDGSVFRQHIAFRDGLGCCLIQSKEGLIWMVINSDGDIVFAHDGNEDFTILGVGGGYVLMAEHIADFDHNEWRIGAIDATGEMVVPYKVYEKVPPKGPDAVSAPAGDPPDPNVDYWGYLDYMEQLEAYESYQNFNYQPEPLTFDSVNSYPDTAYLGDGIFQLFCENGYNLLNINTQQVIYTEDSTRWEDHGRIISFLSDFENGSAIIFHDDEVTDIYDDYRVIGLKTVSSIDTDGNITMGESNEWIERAAHSTIQFSDGLAFFDESYVHTGVYGVNGCYCDYFGNEVVDIPEYHGSRQYIGDPFRNGHAALLVAGADGQWYFTAIDQTGQILFDPKPGFNGVLISDDGNYLAAGGNGSITVFDIYGTPLLEVNYIGIDANALFTDRDFLIHSKVLKVVDFYVNVETGAVIGAPKQYDRNFSVTVF